MRGSAGVAIRSAKQLPEYREPPLVEVACSVQFETIEQLDTAHLGLLWAEYRQRYPVTQQHPPLPNITESFGPPGAVRLGVNFLETMPVARAWFLNSNQTQLIQVQPDHFVVNWRKLETEAAYPRYDNLKATLEREFDVFARYLEREGLPPVVPNQVELTYVNHLPAGEREKPRLPPQKFLRLWSGDMSADADAPEDVAFQLRYLVRDSNTQSPVGRLYVGLESRFFARTQDPLYGLTLTARGAPLDSTFAGALALLDMAHVWIVEKFTAITTPEMHQAWGRTR